MGSPLPTPMTVRPPPATASIVAAILATRPGGRSTARVTRLPTVTRSVSVAAAASVVNSSSDGRSEGAPGGKK